MSDISLSSTQHQAQQDKLKSTSCPDVKSSLRTEDIIYGFYTLSDQGLVPFLIQPPIHPFTHYPPIYPFTHPRSICPSTYPPTNSPNMHPLTYLFIHPSIYPLAAHATFILDQAYMETIFD